MGILKAATLSYIMLLIYSCNVSIRTLKVAVKMYSLFIEMKTKRQATNKLIIVSLRFKNKLPTFANSLHVAYDLDLQSF